MRGWGSRRNIPEIVGTTITAVAIGSSQFRKVTSMRLVAFVKIFRHSNIEKLLQNVA